MIFIVFLDYQINILFEGFVVDEFEDFRKVFVLVFNQYLSGLQDVDGDVFQELRLGQMLYLGIKMKISFLLVCGLDGMVSKGECCCLSKCLVFQLCFLKCV